MIFRIALFSVMLLVNINIKADIPITSSYLEINDERFGDYFEIGYSERDGGEILINFSHIFVKKLACEKCLIDASINIFNTQGDVLEWAQVAGVNFSSISVTSASKQKLYAAGLKEKVNISLSYIVRSCGSSIGSEKIIFKFDEIRKLKRKN